MWGSTGCGSKRLDSDVSAVADYLTGFDIYDSYNCGSACSPAPGWFTVGGTSLSSPIIAASYGLAGGAHGVAYPALTLYGHQGKAYDVTTGATAGARARAPRSAPTPTPSGTASWTAPTPPAAPPPSATGPVMPWPATTGRPASARPNGITMFTKTGPSATISGPTTVTHGTSQTWNAATADPFPGGTVTSYTWNWGDGTGSTTTTTGTAAHTYATGGVTRTITLTVTDNYGVTGTATYTVKVS